MPPRYPVLMTKYVGLVPFISIGADSIDNFDSTKRSLILKFNSMAATIEIKVNPLKDVLDIRKGKLMTDLKGHKVDPGMVYEVSLKSNANYGGDTVPPIRKVVLYNTTDKNPNGWFYVIEEGSPAMIKIGGSGDSHDKVYLFFVDISSQDNSGEATVTLKPVC